MLAQRPWSLDNAAKYLRNLANGGGDTNLPDIEWVFKAQRPHEFRIGIPEDISLCPEPQPVHIQQAPARRPKAKAKSPAPLERAAPAAELAPLQPGQRLQEKSAAVLKRPAAAEPEPIVGAKIVRRVHSIEDFPDVPADRLEKLGCSKCVHAKLGCTKCRNKLGIFWNEPSHGWVYMPPTLPTPHTELTTDPGNFIEDPGTPPDTATPEELLDQEADTQPRCT